MSTSNDKPLLTGKHAPCPRGKKQADGEPKKKQGNPGNFFGDRLDTLLEALPGYLAASAKGRGHVQPYLDEFMSGWWKCFPWYEGLDSTGRPLPKGAVQSTDLGNLLSLEPKSDNEDDSPNLGDDPHATPNAPVGLDASHAPLVLGTDTATPGASRPDAPEADEPNWTSTGGMNPALKGPIQIDVTEVRDFLGNLNIGANRGLRK
jgi:hypothetical protein